MGAPPLDCSTESRGAGGCLRQAIARPWLPGGTPLGSRDHKCRSAAWSSVCVVPPLIYLAAPCTSPHFPQRETCGGHAGGVRTQALPCEHWPRQTGVTHPGARLTLRMQGRTSLLQLPVHGTDGTSADTVSAACAAGRELRPAVCVRDTGSRAVLRLLRSPSTPFLLYSFLSAHQLAPKATRAVGPVSLAASH